MSVHLQADPPQRLLQAHWCGRVKRHSTWLNPQHDVPFTDTCDLLTPDEDPRRVTEWLATLPDVGPVLLVSHNPLTQPSGFLAYMAICRARFRWLPRISFVSRLVSQALELPRWSGTNKRRNRRFADVKALAFDCGVVHIGRPYCKE